MKLPIYELVLSGEQSGVHAVALVGEPAIGVNYQAFKEQKMKFEIVDDSERVIMGAAMIPNLPIYRNDSMGEYQAIFKKETIKELAHKFFKEGRQGKFNKNHDENDSVEGLTIFQSFITSEKMGIQPPKGFENIADGSWFIAAKVEDEDLWNELSLGEALKGFSIEGLFEVKPFKQNMSEDEEVDEIVSDFAKTLKEYLSK